MAGNNFVWKITGTAQTMNRYKAFSDQVKRQIARKMVRGAATIIAREVRKEIKSSVGKGSRSRMTKKQALASTRDSSSGLARHIVTNTFTYPANGIIGVAVGGAWPEGAHAHLVEYGHEIVIGNKRTGKRTRPNRFQERAERRSFPMAQLKSFQIFQREMSTHYFKR